MGKRKQPVPLDEEPKQKATRRLSPEEIQSHREFLEDEEPGDIERILRFLPAAGAKQVRSVVKEIDVKRLKQRSRDLLEKYDADGYVEVPVVVLPPALRQHPFTPEDEEPADVERVLRCLPVADADLVRGVTREIDFKKARLKIRELLEKYEAKGHAEVPVVAVRPASTTPPDRVSEARVTWLRRFMEQSFCPVPERVLRSRFFSESQAEAIRNFNRVCLEAEADLKAHVVKALEEYDAKGYLECTADGKIKVSE